MINPEFNIPFYVFEAIVDYIEESAQGKCKVMKWANIKSHLSLAKYNNRLTESQVNYLLERYCREK